MKPNFKTPKKVIAVVGVSFLFGVLSFLYTNVFFVKEEDSLTAKLQGFQQAIQTLIPVYANIPGVKQANFQERQDLFKKALSDQGFLSQVLNAGQILALDLQKAGFTVDKSDPFRIYITGGNNKLGEEIARNQAATGAKFGISVVNNIIQSTDLGAGSNNTIASFALADNLISLGGGALRSLSVTQGDMGGTLNHESVHNRLMNDLEFSMSLFSDYWTVMGVRNGLKPNQLEGLIAIRANEADFALAQKYLNAESFDIFKDYFGPQHGGINFSEIEARLVQASALITKMSTVDLAAGDYGTRGDNTYSGTYLTEAVVFSLIALRQSAADLITIQKSVSLLSKNEFDVSIAGATTRISYYKQMISELKAIATKAGLDLNRVDNIDGLMNELFPSGLPPTDSISDAKAAQLMNTVKKILSDVEGKIKNDQICKANP